MPNSGYINNNNTTDKSPYAFNALHGTAIGHSDSVFPVETFTRRFVEQHVRGWGQLSDYAFRY